MYYISIFNFQLPFFKKRKETNGSQNLFQNASQGIFGSDCERTSPTVGTAEISERFSHPINISLTEAFFILNLKPSSLHEAKTQGLVQEVGHEIRFAVLKNLIASYSDQLQTY